MKPLLQYPLWELKLVYRALHGALRTQVELMDADLLADLQAHLRKVAREDGVDTSDHGAWDAWLGNSEQASPPRARSPLTLLPGGQS